MVRVWPRQARKASFVCGTRRLETRCWQFALVCPIRVFSLSRLTAIPSYRTARLGRYNSGKPHPAKSPPGIPREPLPVIFFTSTDTTLHFFSPIEVEHEESKRDSCRLNHFLTFKFSLNP